jgi:hypothetical protein
MTLKFILPFHGIRLDNLKKVIVTFFESEEVAWCSPNTRDYVRIPGTSERKSRAYLLCSLKEAFSLFHEKHPESKIGLAKFCSL